MALRQRGSVWTGKGVVCKYVDGQPWMGQECLETAWSWKIRERVAAWPGGTPTFYSWGEEDTPSVEPAEDKTKEVRKPGQASWQRKGVFGGEGGGDHSSRHCRVMLGRRPRCIVGTLCWGSGITRVSQEEETQDLGSTPGGRSSGLGQPASSVYLPDPSGLTCQEHGAGQTFSRPLVLHRCFEGDDGFNSYCCNQL